MGQLSNIWWDGKFWSVTRIHGFRTSIGRKSGDQSADPGSAGKWPCVCAYSSGTTELIHQRNQSLHQCQSGQQLLISAMHYELLQLPLLLASSSILYKLGKPPTSLVLALKSRYEGNNALPCQESNDGWRKERLRLGISALCSLQCFDTVGWVTRTPTHPAKLVLLISKSSLLEQAEEENRAENANIMFIWKTAVKTPGR